MAQRIERFTTVAAAGVTGSYVAHTFLDGIVRRVELYVPAGHAGLTEWSFWFGQAQLLPKTAGSRVVANDKQFEWDVEDAPEGSGYRSLITNTDVLPHRFYVEVWLDEIGDEATAVGIPILVVPFAG